MQPSHVYICQGNVRFLWILFTNSLARHPASTLPIKAVILLFTVCLHPTLSLSLTQPPLLTSCDELASAHYTINTGLKQHQPTPMPCTPEESAVEGGVDSDKVVGSLESRVESSVKITWSLFFPASPVPRH